MAFFTPEKLKRRKIVVDESAISCDSVEVKNRLNRIEDNYEKLDSILAELELKMATDERLKAIDASTPDDFESTFGIKQKRKWRPAKKKKKRKTDASARRSKSKSADPRKPR